MGASGSCKSDLALRLIDRGWSLVSDDYVTLECRGGKLVAAPPEQIAGRMEVRHVGLIRLPFITGVPVCLAIFLDRAPERLPDADVWKDRKSVVSGKSVYVRVNLGGRRILIKKIPHK